MFSLRTHAIICAVLFVALFGSAIVGSALQRAGMSPPTGTARVVAMVCYFTLFVAFGLSAIPVMVKLVMAGQEKIGNQDVAAISAALRHEKTIIWTLWGLIGAGLVVAVPAAVVGGMFGDAPQRAVRQMFRGPNLGVLAAKPDMTLDEMVAQSTLKLELRYASAVIAGGQNGTFDFKIPGTTLTFPGARYYYMTTYSADQKRLEAVNVGTSPDKAPVASLDSADAALRARLVTDGWLAGHEVFRTEEDRTLHRGRSQGPEGQLWLKDGVVLNIGRKAMDDAKAGEDSTAAGQWIQFIQLWSAKTYPNFERYVFQAARAGNFQ
jgi:hypothetical protein